MAGEEVYGDATIISDPSTSATIYADWLLLSNDVEQVKAAYELKIKHEDPALLDQLGVGVGLDRRVVLHSANQIRPGLGVAAGVAEVAAELWLLLDEHDRIGIV